MQEGKIEHLSEAGKGFGFLKVERYEKNVFFHVKDLQKVSFEELQKGDMVNIEEVVETPKGYAAKGITLQ